MKHSIPANKREWLLNTAWKRMTVQQIAKESKVSASAITQLYKAHGIEPMKHRDFIAAKLIDLCNNSEKQFKNIHELSLLLDCSDVLVKELIREYGLGIKIRPYKTPGEKQKPLSEYQIKVQAAKEHDERIAKAKQLRNQFTIYTQSGSALTDSVRQINTTLRPETYLTNAKL